MAITPPSDIVLDVARAADPEKYRVAAERLARLRESTRSAETFSVPPAQAPAAAPASANATAAPPTHAVDPAPGRQVNTRLDAYGRFEAFVLQSFVQSMLPKNATSVFGKGSAGEFWKSMLAEKMGEELARSGQVGIARRLAVGPSHPVQPETVVTAGPPASPPSLLSTLTTVGVQAPAGEEVSDPAPAAVSESERS